MLGVLAACAVALAVSAGAAWFLSRNRAPAASETTELPKPPQLKTDRLAIQRGDTLEDLLQRAGLDAGVRTQVIAAVGAAFDVKKFRAGSNLALTRSETGTMEGLEYIVDPDHSLQLSRDGEEFRAVVAEIPGTVRATPVCGRLEGSLFESIERAGERPELTLRIADIFGWQLDFYTDPREGDEFCAIVEKKEYTNGQPATYRRILAATYKNAGALYDAYLFSDEGGTAMYYSRDGQSLRSAFLRSPMRFEARVSSHFSGARRHPILKIVRPHMGTDYAAPTGTPVQAVGTGTVTFAARSGASGNMVKVRHTNGYETQYLHLSRILVGAGQRVEQGQQIGLVGATGLATGPHLDFRISRNGRYVNFERLRLPPATSISAQRMAEFSTGRERFLALMQTALAARETLLAETLPSAVISAEE
jgi:murein DD-endopeptidase MepM/ murein hydrolase activator NlpD